MAFLFFFLIFWNFSFLIFHIAYHLILSRHLGQDKTNELPSTVFMKEVVDVCKKHNIKILYTFFSKDTNSIFIGRSGLRFACIIYRVKENRFEVNKTWGIIYPPLFFLAEYCYSKRYGK